MSIVTVHQYNITGQHVHNIADVVGLLFILNSKINLTEKNALNGVAALDSNGKLDPAVLPVIAFQDVRIAADQDERLSLADCVIGQTACRQTNTGELYILVAEPVSENTSWILVSDSTPDWSFITNKPTTFTPSTHTHGWSEITDKPTSFTPSSHTHSPSDLTSGGATSGQYLKWNGSGWGGSDIPEPGNVPVTATIAGGYQSLNLTTSPQTTTLQIALDADTTYILKPEIYVNKTSGNQLFVYLSPDEPITYIRGALSAIGGTNSTVVGDSTTSPGVLVVASAGGSFQINGAVKIMTGSSAVTIDVQLSSNVSNTVTVYENSTITAIKL